MGRLTVRAELAELVFEMGDGTVLRCVDPAPNSEGIKLATPSPNCGHVYQMRLPRVSSTRSRRRTTG